MKRMSLPSLVWSGSSVSSLSIRRWLAGVLCALFITAPARGGAAGNAPEGFRLKPGFQLEVAASSPDVTAPVAMAFDADGRLFVAELRGFPQRLAGEPPPGRIRLLEDRDGDGRFERSSVFAEELAWPSALACYDGGLFVAAAPDLLYLKDTTGEGRANVRRVVFTGFGGTNAPAPGLLVNSLKWGPDNRIYGVAGGLFGWVNSPAAHSDFSTLIQDTDFSFDPRSLDLRPETGPGLSGLTFDSRGRRFVTDPNRPLRKVLVDQRYLARNPFYAKPPAFLDVVSPSPLVWRYQGASMRSPPGAGSPVASTNDLALTFLTGARGSLVYQGTAFPSNYYDTVFVPDPEHHIIHHEVLREDGLRTLAERPADGRTNEFLVGEDPLFNPVQLVTTPDGSLLIADFHGGGEEGRIYRITPAQFPRRSLQPLSVASVAQLVTALQAANAWNRDTAARLLFERQDPAAIPLLTNMFYLSRLPRARLQALQVLGSTPALQPAAVARGMVDSDETIRVRALVLMERLVAGGAAPAEIVQAARRLTADPSIVVRHQLALSLGASPGAGIAPYLAEIIARDPGNPFIRSGVLTSCGEAGGALLGLLVADPRFRASPAGFQFIQELACSIGVSGYAEQVKAALAAGTAVISEPVTCLTALNALGEGLRRTRSSLGLVDVERRLQPVNTLALNLVVDDGAIWPARGPAFEMLANGTFSYPEAADWLFLLIAGGNSFPVQATGVRTLGMFLDPRVGPDLLQRWPQLLPLSRTVAIPVLLNRQDRILTLLAGLESRRILPGDLSQPQVNFLRTHDDPGISQRATRLLGSLVVTRPEVVAKYRRSLELAGLANRGREVFAARCAACHRLGNLGRAIGPDLAASKGMGKEKLLSAILEPNADVAPGFTTAALESLGVEARFGILADENPATVTLRGPDIGELVWPTANIRSLRRLSWSLMPVGVEAGLNEQGMADLLQFILTSLRSEPE